jgi:hypothetical protein
MGEMKFENKPQVTKSQGLAVIFWVANFHHFVKKDLRKRIFYYELLKKTLKNNFSIKQLLTNRQLSNITKIKKKRNTKIKR